MLAMATVLFAIAHAPLPLVIGRCLQGASAGSLWTIGFTIVIDTVSRDEVGSRMGFAMSGMIIDTAFGLFVGDVVYEKLDYYSVFVFLITLNFFMP